MRRIMSGNSNGPVWLLAFLGAAAAVGAYFALPRPHTPTYDSSNVPGCVSERRGDVQGNINLEKLAYERITQYNTDNDNLHKQFLAQVFSRISQYKNESQGSKS